MDMYCRTCFRANGSRKFDISAVSQVSDVQIGDMLIYCLQIEISPYDMLPQKICEGCLSALNSMFLFRKHCYHSDTAFRKMLKYAPPQQHPPIPNMELELNLVDAQQPDQNFASETIDLKPDERSNLDSLDQPTLELQESLIAEESIDELADKSVVVEKYHSKLFECEQCDYRSSVKFNINRHQQCRDHTGIRITIPSEKAQLKAVKKLQSCEECGFQTFIRSNFLRHQRIWKHSKFTTRNVEVKRVLEKCPTCPHCGLQRANLQVHMAQWCRVLRGIKKRKTNKEHGESSSKSAVENVTVEGSAPSMQMTDFKIEIDSTVDLKPDEASDFDSLDQPPLEPQESLIAEESIGELTEKSVVVEKYHSKLFECEQCDYRSSVKFNINRHQQCRAHTGIRIIIPSDKAQLKAVKKLQCCEECGFQTFIRSNFLRHQRIWKHTKCTTRDVEVKRVLEKCPTCPHCGLQRANLQVHMAQWCRVLRGIKKKKKINSKHGASSSKSAVENVTDERSAPSMQTIDFKIEIDSSNEIVS